MGSVSKILFPPYLELELPNWISVLFLFLFFKFRPWHTLQNLCGVLLSFVYNFFSKVFIEANSISDQNSWPNLPWKLFLFLLSMPPQWYLNLQHVNSHSRAFSWKWFWTSRSRWFKPLFKNHYIKCSIKRDIELHVMKGRIQCQEEYVKMGFCWFKQITITRLPPGSNNLLFTTAFQAIGGSTQISNNFIVKKN